MCLMLIPATFDMKCITQYEGYTMLIQYTATLLHSAIFFLFDLKVTLNSGVML